MDRNPTSKTGCNADAVYKSCAGCILIVACIIFAGIIVSGVNDIRNPKKPLTPEQLDDQRKWHLQNDCEYAVKAYLRSFAHNPDSLDVLNYSKVVERTDGGYMLRCKYRAKNGFGALILKQQVFILDKSEVVTNVVDFNIHL